MSARDEAYHDWKSGMKYKDIASKYGVSESTVKSWASRYWKGEKVATKTRKKLQPKSSKVATENIVTETVVKAMADEADKNPELTDKQREFCVRFMQNRNATLAYMKAYNCSYETALSAGPRMFGNVRIQNELKRLREIKNSTLGFLCGDDIVEMHMKIAFADITDFVDFKTTRKPIIANGEILTVTNPNTGEKSMRSYLDTEVTVHDSSTVDGSLISEVYTEKGEIRIKLADKMKSLKFLEDYFELNPKDKHKHQYDIARLKLEKERFKLIKDKDVEDKTPPVFNINIVPATENMIPDD
ncbi:MAG: terminase small subunit [Ruminococcus sp.]|nr:terminase small subunit [Ruminococcus sp.]